MSVRPLSISVRSDLIVTTKPSGDSLTGISVSGFEGTFARNRAGFRGVRTRKMISTTSRTSIRGVTLIEGFAPAVWCSAGSGLAACGWVMAVVLLVNRLDRRNTEMFQVTLGKLASLTVRLLTLVSLGVS